MITSYMGISPLTILSVSSDGNWATVRRESDGAIREWRICDLRSDTLEELEEALLAANTGEPQSGRGSP
jgi:hypothetical protein